MNRKSVFMALFLSAVLVLSACENSEAGRKGQKNPIKYTIVPADEADDVLIETIEKYKQQRFHLTYEDSGRLWAVVGYGTKPTAGYSMTVDEVYECEGNVYIKTSVIGPQKSDRMPPETTWPYIIIMLDGDFENEAVVFETP